MDIPFVGFQKKNASVINTPTFTECRNMAKKKNYSIGHFISYQGLIYSAHTQKSQYFTQQDLDVAINIIYIALKVTKGKRITGSNKA